MEVQMRTTILATVVDILPITKPSDKDKEQGFKIKVVLKHEHSQQISGKEYGEVHFYSIKMKETTLKTGEKIVVEGRTWEIDGLKGFSDFKILKVG
jgi:hypothetical protein